MWRDLIAALVLAAFAAAQNWAGARAARASAKLWAVKGANWDTILDALLIAETLAAARMEWIPVWAILCALPGGWVGSYYSIRAKQVQERVKRQRKRERRLAAERADSDNETAPPPGPA